MYGHDLLIIRCLLTQKKNKNVNGLGVGISTVFEIFGHLLYQGDRITPYSQMLLNIRNKNICGLVVRISMVFEILGHFL
jgi:hypothetical protein